MAFVAGFCSDDPEKIGKDIKLEAPDEMGRMREMRRTKDESWEAAMGAVPLTDKNQWGKQCFTHLFSFKMVKCESVCWRIGVCSEEFPVRNLWQWFDKFENGTPPPWGVFLSGGKTDAVVAMPPTIMKSGGTRVRLQYRPPEKERLLRLMNERSVCDELGRLKLGEGDIIGVMIDTGNHHGDGQITFFINGIQIHETVHVFSEPGQSWYPYVCLGSDKIKVRMQSTGESIAQGHWDIPEEHEIRKADILASKGEPPFQGAGWMLSKQLNGTWKRSWYALNMSSFRWNPHSVLYITLHKGRNLVAMDASGTSDPFVEFRCGKQPWIHGKSSDKDKGFTSVRSRVVQKNLNPKWNEELVLPLHHVDGVLSMTCFDKDILGSDVIGMVYINMSDIFVLSGIAAGIRKLYKKWYTLKNGPDQEDQGQILVSMYVGEVERNEGTVKSKSLFSFGPKLTGPEDGNMLLDDLSGIRKDNEAGVIAMKWRDPQKDGAVQEVTLKPEKEEDLDSWLSEINRSVSIRVVTKRAVARIEGWLTGDLDIPVASNGAVMNTLDPSEFHDLGFSRVARTWSVHPLMKSDKELMEGYPKAFECQLSDEDYKLLCPLLAKNNWITELRFDCFFQVGYMGDGGATALSKAMEKNKSITVVNLKGNQIGDEGAYWLSQMIRVNRTLEILHLDGNSIRKPGTIYILTALSGDAVSKPNMVMREIGFANNIVNELETGIIHNCQVWGDIA